MKIKLNFKGKKTDIEVKKCNLFWMFRGLMFTKKNKAKALLFDFKKSNKIKIHSLFVFFPFIAVWLNNKNKIVEFKVVKPWRILVLSKKSFNRLIEIPINNKYSGIVKILLDKKKSLNTISS